MHARRMTIPWVVSGDVMEKIAVSLPWERQEGLAGVLVRAGCVCRVGGCTGDVTRVTDLLALQEK